MRVGVSAWRLSGQWTGVARYLQYLVKHWPAAMEAGDRATLYVAEPLRPDALPLSASIGAQVVGPKLTNALWENLLLPRAARDQDVLFGPSYTLPLTYRGPSVVAIHSVNQARGIAESWWHTQKYRLAARKADRVIVNAQGLKEDVQAWYGIAPEKIDVIRLGVDEIFRPDDDDARKRDTRRRHGGDERPYIVFVGKLSQRRNVPNLLAAFSALKKRAGIPHRLLLVGPNIVNLPLRDMAAELGIADSLVQTDGKFASHHELVSIYNAADLYVLPSSSDGFSLTLVEAMACGTPVVTVNRGALGEVAEGYALTVEDPTVEALADAMGRVLDDDALRQRLRALGLERARSFRWEDTARRTLDVLRKVAES